jgi:hypothetical protein
MAEVIRSWQNVQIRVRARDGFVNATAIGTVFGKPLWLNTHFGVWLTDWLAPLASLAPLAATTSSSAKVVLAKAREHRDSKGGGAPSDALPEPVLHPERGRPPCRDG